MLICTDLRGSMSVGCGCQRRVCGVADPGLRGSRPSRGSCCPLPPSPYWGLVAHSLCSVAERLGPDLSGKLEVVDREREPKTRSRARQRQSFLPSQTAGGRGVSQPHWVMLFLSPQPAPGRDRGAGRCLEQGQLVHCLPQFSLSNNCQQGRPATEPKSCTRFLSSLSFFLSHLLRPFLQVIALAVCCVKLTQTSA